MPRTAGNRRRAPVRIVLQTGTVLLLLLVVFARVSAAPGGDIMPLEEVREGQRGYGFSVFSGTGLERFEVEVLGVVRNLDPGISYVLARLTGHNLEQMGVPAGMSGSPVYIDGRLVGAVSFGWSYSQEAIAGITPIGAMRGMPRLPSPSRGPRFAGPPFQLHHLLSGPPQELVQEYLRPPRVNLPTGAVSGLQWSAAGFGEGAMGRLRQVLGTVVPAGHEPLPEVELQGGSPVAAILVSGDFQLAATGTVTERRGDEILAFGHSFLGSGPIRVPMAAASVVTVISSRADSFKISNVGQVIGAFEHDGHSGIRGRLGLEAPTIPLVLRVRAGEQIREYRMRMAAVSQLMPAVLASTVLAGLESASYFGGTQGLDMTARLEIAKYGGLELRQSFDGANAAQECADLLLAIAGYIEQNSFEDLEVEAIEIDVTQVREPRTAVLVSARAESSVVRPGDTVALELQFSTYRGGLIRRSVSIPIPNNLTPGRYTLLVGDGTSVDTTVLGSIEPIEPIAFAQAMKVMRSLHSRRDLMVLGITQSNGLAVDGEVLPRLPSSVLSLWSVGPGSGGATMLRQTIAQRHVERMDMPILGQMRIELEVRNGHPALLPRTAPAPVLANPPLGRQP